MTVILAHHASFQAVHSLDVASREPAARIHGHVFDVTARWEIGEDITPDMQPHPAAEIDYWIANYVEGQNLSEVLPFPASGAAVARHLFDVFKLFAPTMLDVEVIVDMKTGFTYTPDAIEAEDS